MILTRLGSKRRLYNQIAPYIPPHKTWIEPFFGAGGMYFSKPKAKFNIVNDIDGDVFNLFMVVSKRKDELIEAFMGMPIHADLLEYWMHNEEMDPIMKALRFIFLSNFTYLGKQDTLHYRPSNKKNLIYKNIDRTQRMLDNVVFNNADFRIFFKNLNFPEKDFGKPSTVKSNTFAYLDPPYIGTTSTYDDNGWNIGDLKDLITITMELDIRFALSEMQHPDVMDLVRDMGLNITVLSGRSNIKNRCEEILAMNYTQENNHLF